MKKQTIEEVKQILNKIPKKCVKSIEIIPEKYDSECITTNIFGKSIVRWWNGEWISGSNPEDYKNILENDCNEFWCLGRYHYLIENKRFKQLSYVLIKLHKLENLDIKKSVENTLDIIVWNEEGDCLNIFKELKDFILSERPIGYSEKYFNFELQNSL